MSKNPVVHFEMPYTDKDRVSKFYTDAFGWEMQPQGEDLGGYVVAVATELDEKTHRPKDPGSINGGFYLKTKSNNPFPSFVIGVQNLKKAVEMVKQAGGKIESEPAEIPGIGMWAVFTDSEGNKVSLLEPKGM